MWSVTYRNQFGEWVTVGRWETMGEANRFADGIDPDAEPMVHTYPVVDLVTDKEEPPQQLDWRRYVFGVAVIAAGFSMIAAITRISVFSWEWLGIFVSAYLLSLGFDLCAAARRSKWPWEMQ